jgi:hypothetical protein
MKHQLILLTFFIVFSFQAQEKTTFTKEEIKSFIELSCSNAFRLAGSEQRPESCIEIENNFLKILNITRETPNYKLKIAKFWNTYNHLFICTDKPTRITRKPEHFLKRVVSIGMYETILYDFLLSDPETFLIDVNAVEMVKGKPETLLDYIDYIVGNSGVKKEYDISQINDLRTWLVEYYSAKKAAELK